MDKLPVRIIVLLLLLGSSLTLRAQQALITMKDSARVATEVQSVKNNLLIVKEGALSLNLIAIIQFQNTDQQSLDPVLVENLLKADIVVYVGSTKLVKEIVKEVIPPPDTVRKKTPQLTRPAVTPQPADETPKQVIPKPVPPSDSTIVAEALEKGKLNNFYGGVGLGLDYGGVGGRITYIPGDDKKTSFGVFFAAGLALNGIGFNAGLNLRIGEKRLVPTLSAMYGYNGVIKIIGAPQYDKTYYGPSVALGFENKTRNSDDNFIHVELIIPFRSAAFHNDLKALQNNPGIEINDPSPVLISIGYHFKF